MPCSQNSYLSTTTTHEEATTVQTKIAETFEKRYLTTFGTFELIFVRNFSKKANWIAECLILNHLEQSNLQKFANVLQKLLLNFQK